MTSSVKKSMAKSLFATQICVASKHNQSRLFCTAGQIKHQEEQCREELCMTQGTKMEDAFGLVQPDQTRFFPNCVNILEAATKRKKRIPVRFLYNHKEESFSYDFDIHKSKNDEVVLMKLEQPSGTRPQIFTCELISNFPVLPLEILSNTVMHQVNFKEKVLILMSGCR